MKIKINDIDEKEDLEYLHLVVKDKNDNWLATIHMKNEKELFINKNPNVDVDKVE